MEKREIPRKRMTYSRLDDVLNAVFMDSDSCDENGDSSSDEDEGSDSDFSIADFPLEEDELRNPNNDHDDEDALMDIDDDIDSDYTTETQNRGVRTRGCGVRIRGGAKQRRHINPKQVSVPRGRGSRRGRGGGHGHKLDQWIWAETDKDDFVPRDPVFVGNEGLLIRTHSQTPHDFFKMYMTDNIFSLVVEETNRYAEQFFEERGDSLKEHSRVKTWHPTNLAEMKCFIGLSLLMGVIYKPRIPMYWSTDDMLSTPLFGQVMTRDRYLLIMKFLHFSNNRDLTNDQNEDRDRLHKVRPFIRKIQERCRRVYEPGQYLSVDESLLLYKGRLYFKQFIRTKRARFGIKFYELCTHDGITLDFLIYSGDNLFRDHLNPEPDMLATEKIPINLMLNYLHKGHILYTDNYYTSPALAKYFFDNGTYICGTINPKRSNYARDLISKDLQRGETYFQQHDNKFLAVKYRATQNKSGNKPKLVYMLSTAHKADIVDTGKKDREGHQIVKPTCIDGYNKHMGGVDLVDMQLHAIKTVRKTYKWYTKVVFRLIMQCCLNAHKVYLKTTGSKVDFLHYMISIIQDLLTSSPRLNKEAVRTDTIARLTGRHFPTQKSASSDERKDKRPTKACRVCWARGFRLASGREIKTVWICEQCPSKPGLHADKDCFKVYHSVLDYSACAEE